MTDYNEEFLADPTGHLVAVVDDHSDAEAIEEELRAASFEQVHVYRGRGGAETIDSSGADHGVSGGLVRGVQQAFSPERDSGRRMARRLLNPNMLEFVPLIPGYSVVEVKAPAWMHGKTLQEIGLRRKWNVAAIVIRTDADELQMLPAGDALVRPGDSLTVVGRDDDLAKLGGSGA